MPEGRHETGKCAEHQAGRSDLPCRHAGSTKRRKAPARLTWGGITGCRRSLLELTGLVTIAKKKVEHCSTSDCW